MDLIEGKKRWRERKRENTSSFINCLLISLSCHVHEQPIKKRLHNSKDPGGECGFPGQLRMEASVHELHEHENLTDEFLHGAACQCPFKGAAALTRLVSAFYSDVRKYDEADSFSLHFKSLPLSRNGLLSALTHFHHAFPPGSCSETPSNRR